MVELVWEGKYDKDGKRAAPLRVALPFQTVETVNESAQQRQRTLDLFAAGRDAEWRNRLIWGDKKYVLPSLLPEFAGEVDLIYIDPPFATGQDFSFQAQVGDDEFTKVATVIEQKAYRDTWAAKQGKAKLKKYLPWIYDTAVIFHELLNENGSLYVHCDDGVSHYVKTIFDEVFGYDNFLNHITWRRATAHNDPKRYGRIQDHILYYSKGQNPTWNGENVTTTKSAKELEKAYPSIDERGRFRSQDLTGPLHGNPRGSASTMPWRRYDVFSLGRCWSVPKSGKYAEYIEKHFISNYRSITDIHERLELLDNAGLIHHTKTGKWPGLKRYSDADTGILPQDIILEPIGFTNYRKSLKQTGYDTEKPEALLQRIIGVSSKEGDLVLDCFCGSGTTAAVAEKLNRRWIACDLGRFGIHTSRKRLLGIENVRPFVVQNLGKYERQVWQKAEFGEEAAFQMRSYRKFILDLYHAEMVDGYTWLHGRKGGRMVHVGSVDSPVAVGDVRQIAIEFQRAIGTGKHAPTLAGVDILGWDFALDTNETAQQTAAEAGLKVRFLRIPREVLEKKAVDQGDIKFFELAALSVDKSLNGRELSVWLTDFMIPPDDVPDDVAKAVRHWEDWIDYWAVDFNYRDDTFHNQRQTYRTRKDRTLLPRLNYTYSEPGEYVVLVKVIDILGNDSTKTLNVKVM